MIIEYDIECYERTLKIIFPKKYQQFEADYKDEILAILDNAYDKWTHLGEIEDIEEQNYVCCCPCEEYLMECLSETYNMWTEWKSVDWED